MTVQAKYSVADNRVIEVLEKLSGIVYIAEDGEAIVDITNFANVEDITNAANDYIVSGETLVYTPVSPSDELVADAKNIVDSAASHARDRYVTKATGQEMTYLRKEDDAKQHKADGYPADLTNYPWIQAEVNATGVSATEATDGILAQRDAWLTIGVAIEEARRLGKVNIGNAANATDAIAARDAAVAALDAL